MTDKRITFDSTTNRVYSDSYLDTQPTEDGYIRFNIACGDGEHDRWDTCVVGYLDPLVWDCATRTLL